MKSKFSGFGRCLVLLAMMAGAIISARLPAADTPAEKTVQQWDIFEAQISGPADGNPFTEVQVSCNFSDGSRIFTVNGFYDGGGIYRIRFMPDHPGGWSYTTASNIPALAGKTGSFQATPATGKNHGPVHVSNTYHFAYGDGTAYNQIGTTSYIWVHAPDDWEDQTLKTLAESPFNKIRMLVFPHNDNFRKTIAPTLFPFEGTPPRNWDLTRPNPAFFQHLEKRIGQLRDLNIEADLILFHPYGNNYGFNNMGAAADDLYLRYITARLGAYRNVWWSLANEWDFIRAKTEADFVHYGEVVSSNDPYGHMLSIHNGALIFNNTLPWITHSSIQNGDAVVESSRAELYRDVFRKPVVYDEVKYEGTGAARWAQLTPEEMVHRFWEGTIGGTYVGHSEYIVKDGDYWLAYGGKMYGQSAPRLAFLKKVLDDGPVRGTDQIDKWQDSPISGVPGQYYLVYFGLNKPTSWAFQLYKNGLRDGLHFKVEILDTWNMTITPVDGDFVTAKKDNYYFVAEQGRAITLPGKPYIALRIRRVDDAPAVPLTAPNGE